MEAYLYLYIVTIILPISLFILSKYKKKNYPGFLIAGVISFSILWFFDYVLWNVAINLVEVIYFEIEVVKKS